jgi:hypothetical protein
MASRIKDIKETSERQGNLGQRRPFYQQDAAGGTASEVTRAWGKTTQVLDASESAHWYL